VNNEIDLLDERETSEVLGVAKGTLTVWRHRRSQPLRWVQVGRSIRYRRTDIAAFIEANLTEGTSPRKTTVRRARKGTAK